MNMKQVHEILKTDANNTKNAHYNELRLYGQRYDNDLLDFIVVPNDFTGSLGELANENRLVGIASVRVGYGTFNYLD